MILSISIGITQQMPIIRCEVKKDFSYFNTFSLYLNIFNCYFSSKFALLRCPGDILHFLL